MKTTFQRQYWMRGLILIVWASFFFYSVILAPGNLKTDIEIIYQLLTLKISSINPIILMIFTLMGIWPLIYFFLLYTDGLGKKIPSWPFLLLSFGIGAFSLLFYLGIRDFNPKKKLQTERMSKIIKNQILLYFFLLLTIFTIMYGFVFGDLTEYLLLFQSSRFIHVMTLDFTILSLIAPFTIKIDLINEYDNSSKLWLLGMLPLLGLIIYLSIKNKKE